MMMVLLSCASPPVETCVLLRPSKLAAPSGKTRKHGFVLSVHGRRL